MIRMLLVQAALVAGLAGQARPVFAWRLEQSQVEGSAIRPVHGDLPLQVGNAPAFYGREPGQCLLRRPGDSIASANDKMPSSDLPGRSLSVEAWVAIDIAQEWGGILGAIEDNGEDERGWLLGFRERKFCFALCSEKTRRLTYLTAESPFTLGRFYHVLGTYDGKRLRLYVDGELAAETDSQQGPIFYADTHKFVAGAYQDRNEAHKMQGALQTLRVYDSALSARRIKTIFRRDGRDLPQAEESTFTAVPKKAYPSLVTLQPQINTAIDRAVRNILQQQNRDGSWSYSIHGYRNGPTSLSIYALAKSGLPAEHPSIQAALRFLAAKDPSKVYSYGCQLLALASVGAKTGEHREWARRLTEQLIALESRTEPGGWAYPSGAVDLSNTQFAALGFFGAAQLEVPVDPEIWRRMVKKTTLHQPFLRASGQRSNRGGTGSNELTGGFTYFPDGRTYPESGSMTTAGLCVLALADRLCPGGLGSRTLDALHRSKRQALRWLDENFTVSTNPGYPSTTYYYLYGVERIGALLDLEEIGGTPWYRAGAEWLLGKQNEGGDWGRFDETCFGLLFLTRATSPVTGLATRKPEVWTSKGDVQLAATGRVDCSMWVAGFDESVEADDLRIRRVQYLLSGEPIATVNGDPELAWTSESFLASHRFPTAGLRKLSAIVELADGSKLRSAELEITADHDVERWMQDNLEQVADNLLDEVAVEISASRSAEDHAARAALDGLQATAWLCPAKARDPKLTLQWSKPIRANRVVLFPADSNMLQAGHHDQVERLAVTVNRRRIEVTCPKDPLAATVIDLDKTRLVRSIEIQILQRRAGSQQPGMAGFAEVALQLSRK